MSREADVVVLGLGPGGEQAATDLLAAGLSVIGIEAELLGGECPYYGCIPSKMAIRGATVLAETGRVDALSGTAAAAPDWSKVAHRIRTEATDDWNDQIAVDRFTGNGGTFVRGSGRITGPRTVEVDGITYTARQALIVASGARAAIPPVEGIADVPYWTNREALKTREAPASLVVLGGGAIGCEMAQLFARFGATVTIVEFAQRLLALEEPEAGEILETVFAREGIDVRTGVGAARVDSAPGAAGVRVTLTDGSVVSGEVLLVATGRVPDLAALGIESIGLAATKGVRAIRTDDLLRVVADDGAPLDGVYAIGDVAGKGAFTHVSVAQARMVADQILGKPTTEWSGRSVGRVTFTDPEVGVVGLTEASAREAGIDVVTASYPMASTTRGWIHGAGNDGLFKLVVDRANGIVVGGTVIGPHAGEVLSGLTVAVAGKVPLTTLVETVWAYPTYHRGFDAVLAELPAALRPGR